MAKQKLQLEQYASLETAPLFFPITPFSSDDKIDLQSFEQHLIGGLGHKPGAVFAACGAGEFHALSLEEVAQVTELAVNVVKGRRLVFVGAGGPLPTAQALCRLAAEKGADGILLMPPYLVTAPQQGLVKYIQRIATESPLPIVVYARANMRLSIESALAISEFNGVIGIKDGLGDIEQMQRIVTAIDKTDHRILFMNGLPTAEASAAAYRAIGVPIYSSAVFAFAPEIASAFWDGLHTKNRDATDALLSEFYLPFAALRDELPGFAVALIKAGLTLRGLNAGSVRPPFVDPSPAQMRRLEALIERGLGVARQLSGVAA